MALANADPLLQVTGPIHHYVQLYAPFSNGTTAGSAGGIWYLGTCEVQPQVSIKRVSKEVRNDLFGAMLPGQKIYQGQMAQIGAALNYYSQTAYANLLASGGLNGINQGVDGSNAVGALMFGNISFKLWQVNGAYNWSGGSVIPPGRYWPNVMLAEEQDYRTGLVDAVKLLIFEAYKLPVCTTGVRSGVLYSRDTADFPTDVRVPPC